PVGWKTFAKHSALFCRLDRVAGCMDCHCGPGRRCFFRSPSTCEAEQANKHRHEMERFELAASDPVELARLKTLVETGEGIKARYGSESSWRCRRCCSLV